MSAVPGQIGLDRHCYQVVRKHPLTTEMLAVERRLAEGRFCVKALLVLDAFGWTFELRLSIQCHHFHCVFVSACTEHDYYLHTVRMLG